MENVTFVDYYDFKIRGHVYKNAVALGDIDNDNEIELVVGNMAGTLFIYKGSQEIQKISGLGIITAIAIGDLMNCGSNTLVVITGEGWCHIYLCLKLSKSDVTEDSIVKLEPVHLQRIPANTKKLLLCDIDGDGMIELVVTLTDRVIRSYRWSQSATAGRLVPLHKWECHDTVGSIILTNDCKDRPCLLASQPGATIMCIYCPITYPELAEEEFGFRSKITCFLSNEYVTSDMIGDIKEFNKHNEHKYSGQLYSMATLDGTIMLARKDSLIWAKNIKQDIFSLNKVSLNNGDSDYIAACTWSGNVYLVDLNGEISLFKLGERVTAFSSGMYTVKPNTKPLPCFVFVTAGHKVRIYYDMRLPKTCSKSLSACINKNSEMLSIIEEWNEEEEEGEGEGEGEEEEEKVSRSGIIHSYLYHFNPEEYKDEDK